MPRKSTGTYPADWPALARQIKAAAGWRCVRCGHAHDVAAGYMLTVHHLDLNPANCAWWNTPPLCQRCHLQIQHKVILERPWMWEHTPWFRVYAAGYYAFRVLGITLPREDVVADLDYWLARGQPWLERGAR